MIDLPDVTVWSMVWTEEQKWTSKVQSVLRYCREIMNPAQVILFTTKPSSTLDGVQQIQIPALNWQSYNIFINRVIPTYIKTGFAMSVHEDGFPIDVSQWTPEFLEYDYIGAPWNDGVVGNGGFSIESRKLMDLKSDMPLTAEDFSVPSDRLICTTRKQWLEERGIRFAPAELALKFSTEQVGNDRPSFGFHGRAASREKYKGGLGLLRITPQKIVGGEKTESIKFVGGFWRQGQNIVAPPRMVRTIGARPQIIQAPVKPILAPRKIASVRDLEFTNAKPPFEILTLPPATEMTTTVVYVYPIVAGPKYIQYAQRFLDSYKKCPPESNHNTVVVFNGNRPSLDMQQRFTGILPNCTLLQHDNTGYDIGAFQKVSKQCKTDLIVFFGASTYLNGAGWLKRMKEAVEKHRFALYGAMGNRGSDAYQVWPHIRTTAFWLPPSLFNAYPKVITKSIDRHPFEHGPDSFTGWVRKYRIKAWVVTKVNEYEWENWDDDENGFHRGDQHNLLVGDHISEPPYYPPK